jgi:PmbA protein
MKTTGNAGGAHRLSLTSRLTDPRDDLRAMLKKLGTGLFVTELLGHGVSILTGDYSRGASGYWVEGGRIKYPVEEITIAGNLKDIFSDIVAIGADEVQRGAYRTGSMLIGQMAVAG